MSKLLVIAETDGSRVLPSTSSAIAFAQQSGLPFDLLCLGGSVDPSDYADYGAGCVYVGNDARLEHPIADRFAAACREVASRGYFHIACASSTFGRDLLPRLAALLDAPMLSDVLSIISIEEGTYTRPMYAGAATATVQIKGNPILLSVRTTAFEKPERRERSKTEPITIGDLPEGSVWESATTSATGRPDLTQARVVVSGGRPLRDAATFEEYIGGLADLLGGAVGATRAAVDSGLAGNDLQVGQTGKTVAPDLYIAAGISGSTQHLAGMIGSKVIVAINKDPDAPIFEVADYGIVADLYDAIPAMKTLLQRSRGSSL
jgi:electron transfer flavoprotein alpha subunit